MMSWNSASMCRINRAGMCILEWCHTDLDVCWRLAVRYGFRSPPHLELKARPKLGEREVTLVHITDWIEKKLEQELQVWRQLNRLCQWCKESAMRLCWTAEKVGIFLINSGQVASYWARIKQVRFDMAWDVLQRSHFVAFPHFPTSIGGQHLEAHL